MDLGLAGKTAYVTGSATGIGRDVVRLLAAEGVRVFAVDREGDALAEYLTAENLGTVTPFVQDLSTLEGCRTAAAAAVESLGGAPDILNVAIDVGYGSHEAFTRAFREQFGIAPVELRRRR